MWRSLVARLLGVQEAVGSNPAIPTQSYQLFRAGFQPFLFFTVKHSVQQSL